MAAAAALVTTAITTAGPVSAATTVNAPPVGIAHTPTGAGYWEVASDGGIFAFGDAGFYGSMGGKALNASVVGVAASPDGKGYWEVASDGGIFAFGDAGFYGSMGGKALNAPVVGVAATPDGKGYWEVASDGGIFAFGDAGFYGSMGGKALNAPVVGVAASPDGKGYWEVASDGGIFAFGDATYYGSVHYTSPSPQPGGSAAQLASQVLHNGNITINGRCVSDDLTRTANGQNGTSGKPLSAKMLSDLLSIAGSQKVVSCGTGHATDSNHYAGTAIDLVPGSGNTFDNLVRTIYNNRGAYGIDELIHNPMPSGTTTLKHGQPFIYDAATMQEHLDHVHYSVQ